MIAKFTKRLSALSIVCALAAVALNATADEGIVPQKPTAGVAKYSVPDAVKMLKTAETVRSPERADASVDLKTVDPERTVSYDLKILRSTEQRAYIDFLGPKEEIGRKMLAMGRQYWSTFPDSKRVVKISKKEMIGNSAFALADIFQIDSEKDYNPRVIDREKGDKGVDLLRLELLQKHDEAPYPKIEYWIEEKGWFPVRAAFYGISGKLLKTLVVETRKEIAGMVRPHVSRMEDNVTKGRTSWWTTKAMAEVTVPDTVFSKAYLRKQ